MIDLKISEENQREILTWKRLKSNPAWKIICEVLRQKVSEADKIINTIGYDDGKMFTYRDIAITKRNEILDLINYPDIQMEMLAGTGTEPAPNLDPYRSEYEDPEDEI